MKMNVEQIKKRYDLPYIIAKYLSRVSESQDYREYENHKKTLRKLCSSNTDFNKSIKALTDIMKI